jgi:hypothetical protein
MTAGKVTRMRTPLVVTFIVVYIVGIIVLVVVVLKHPPTGSYVCGPVACEPNPNYTPPTPAPSPTPQARAVVIPTAGPDAWWRTVNACQLLTPGQEHDLGFGAGRLASQGEGTCALVQPPGPGQLAPLRLTIDLSDFPHPLLGLVSRQPFAASGGRTGVIAQDKTTGECEVTLQATKGSSVLIYASGSSQDCPLATKVATLISPELPPAGIALVAHPHRLPDLS